MLLSHKKNSRYIANHIKDVYTDLGYDYRKDMFTKTVSKVLMENKNVKSFLDELQKPIAALVDMAKQVRLQYMISLDKNDRNLN